MKYSIICIITLVQLSLTAVAQNSTDNESSLLRQEIAQDLTENILPFWAKYAPDPSGGFYGTLRYDGSPQANADKGEVLNARILWTFSTAYRLLKDEQYKQLADRAQAYFIAHFIDREYGGTYWSIKADGMPGNTNKQTYGIAYGIYGLAEHYRATGNEESLQNAIDLYQTMEKYVFEPVHGGYIESFTRDWKKPERYGYDGSGVAAKTMNTHLHVLEAYTTLYRVWPDTGLQKQLKGIIEVITGKILDQNTWHEKLFLTTDWQNLENIDSYGHDMELSWLLWEAAETLKDEAIIQQVRHIAIRLVETQMKEGWNADGSLIYEKTGDRVRNNLDWWPQAESVVAFLNAWQISNDQTFLDASVKTWNWIKNNLIDREYGEWYSVVLANGTPIKSRAKADMWRCPYHNSRMGFEILSRIK